MHTQVKTPSSSHTNISLHINEYLSSFVLKHIKRQSPFSKVHCLQYSHSSSALPVKTLAYMVGMRLSPVLKQNLSGFTGPRQVVQIFHLIHGPTQKDVRMSRGKKRTRRQFYVCTFTTIPQGIITAAFPYISMTIFFYPGFYLLLLKGDLGVSAVGTICSPGRTHMMGPSSL